MVRRAWPIVVASCALLAACLDDQQALQSSEPLYTMVFFASDSTTLAKRAQDQIANFVANPMGRSRSCRRPRSASAAIPTRPERSSEPGGRAAPRRRRHQIPRRARRAAGADRDGEPRQLQAAGRHRTADVGDLEPARRDRRGSVAEGNGRSVHARPSHRRRSRHAHRGADGAGLPGQGLLSRVRRRHLRRRRTLAGAELLPAGKRPADDLDPFLAAAHGQAHDPGRCLQRQPQAAAGHAALRHAEHPVSRAPARGGRRSPRRSTS